MAGVFGHANGWGLPPVTGHWPEAAYLGPRPTVHGPRLFHFAGGGQPTPRWSQLMIALRTRA